MQAQCPTCAQKIVVDDARAPDRPFSVKCPKCQTPVRFPGRSAAPAAAPPLAVTPPPAPPAPPPEPTMSEEMRADVVAQLRRELSHGEPTGGKGQVLVALADRGQAGALTLPLTRFGYAVDTLDSLDEGGRRLEEGVYDIVITNRTAALPGKTESLCQRVGRLSPEARRRIFLVLVGEEFRTGDGSQAFAALVDLVIHPKDAGSAEGVLLGTLAERSRLYRVFIDARERFEATLG